MTTTNNAAGGQASDGGSDGRSTADVETTLPCACGKVRRCSHRSCLDRASVIYDTRHNYCDEHAGEYLLPILGRVLLKTEGVDDHDDRDLLCGLVGQAKFVSFDPYTPKRGRHYIGNGFMSKAYRRGLVVCDKCGATWIGTEYGLCAWCVDRLRSHYRKPEGGKS